METRIVTTPLVTSKITPWAHTALVAAALMVGGLVLSGCSSDDAGPVTYGQPQGDIQEPILKTVISAASEAERNRNYEAAAGFYSRILKSRPDDPNVVISLSRNLRYASRLAGAVSLMETEAPKHFEHPQLTLEHGKVLLAAGMETAAIRKLEQAVMLAPKNWQARSALGIALDANGAYARAQKSFRVALVLSPENPAVLNNFAMSLAQSGNIGLAVSTLEQAAMLNRNSTQIRQNLALLYGVQGKTEKARALAAMDLDPSEVESNMTFYRRFEGQQ